MGGQLYCTPDGVFYEILEDPLDLPEQATPGQVDQARWDYLAEYMHAQLHPEDHPDEENPHGR